MNSSFHLSTPEGRSGSTKEPGKMNSSFHLSTPEGRSGSTKEPGKMNSCIHLLTPEGRSGSTKEPGNLSIYNIETLLDFDNSIDPDQIVNENKRARVSEDSEEMESQTTGQAEMNKQIRKKRGNYKQRTIKEKYDLLMEFRQNKDQLSQAEFCKKNRIPESTFSGYIIKRNEIINEYEKGEFAHNKIRKRTGWDPNLEIALLLWLREFRQARPGVVITDRILQQAGG
ncbi:MAG: hypothetical protein EZS28_034375 [Streblomastix strix]|uniref:HTH CENPB-type domain-containing protein n=1 Tax=Streblomastix strix TaxID=222440 RepID=A0A5J4UHB9_9EUKA|nr:MAG: hypothetical protein EZS28_034375 [Streblomastix strix]